MRSTASWDTGRAYYAHGMIPVKATGEVMPTHHWGSSLVGQYPLVAQGLCEYFEATGDSEALEFGLALAEGVLADLQPGQGVIGISARDGSYQGHLHHHLYFLAGLAHLAALSSEPRRSSGHSGPPDSGASSQSLLMVR
ncbi:MAG: hypothetical protein HYU36_10305 [Planctomycetes bacterium]|nr:hypothetical protein [Planctomycetota bacterium]